MPPRASWLLPLLPALGSGEAPERPKNCGPRFHPFLGPPKHAIDYNGWHVPDACFDTKEPHVFIIGDWGGILPGHEGNEGGKVSRPADHTVFGQHIRDKQGPDWVAQQQVADAMNKRAAWIKPDYILNVGDSFYWGGVETKCGMPPFGVEGNLQFKILFEDMYKGPGMDDKQWLGVLGNHDYGGWMFTGGWDQTIDYTWSKDKIPGSTGRWVMPAQYWSTKVWYTDFSIDYYFVDSNVFDSDDPNVLSGHNICNVNKSGAGATCGVTGPNDAYDCPGWFKRLWRSQVSWLEKVLPKSVADWQIVVTHFPPTWGREDWITVSRKHGVDLIVSGHRHRQEVHYHEPTTDYEGWPGVPSNFLDPTAWIVSGGGGGVTSEGAPDTFGNDDQYGFVDLTLHKDYIKVDMISHGGQTRQTKWIKRWPSGIPRPDPAHKTKDGNEGGEKAGCGNKEHTFYLYRAQDDNSYSPENINAASLAGLLWYIHHEVVIVCPRKFGITRIRRLKVTVKNLCKLYEKKKTQFGPYVAFDSGMCNIPECDQIWNDFGPVVGCQHIPFDTGVFAAYCRMPSDKMYHHCKYAQWFSFPGPCPQKVVNDKTPECIAEHPSGMCTEGQILGEECTYYIEDAGEIRMDDLYEHPIWDWKSFCATGMEYNNKTDTGSVHFWDGIYDPWKGQQRILAVRDAFKKKYPSMPEHLQDPSCDFFESDPKEGMWLGRTGSAYPRFPGSWFWKY